MADLQRLELALARAKAANDTRSAGLIAAEINRLRGVRAPARAPVADRRVAQATAPDPAVESDRRKTAASIANAQKSIASLTQQLQNPVIQSNPDRYRAIEAAINGQKEALEVNKNRLSYLEKTGKLPPGLTVSGGISDFLRGIPRTLTQFPGQVVEGAAGLIGTGLRAAGAEETGKAISSFGTRAEKAGTEFAEDVFGGRSEATQFSPTARFIAMGGEGVGSTLPYVITSGLGGTAANLSKTGRATRLAGGVPTAEKVARRTNYLIAGAQGSQQAGQQAQEFREQGGTVSPLQELAARSVGAGLGLTEVGAASRMIERLPASARTSAIDSASNLVERATLGRVDPRAAFDSVKRAVAGVEAKALGRTALSTLEESMQEGAVQLGQNLAAKAIYNPNQAAFEGVGESALLGGVVGGTISGGVETTRKVLGSKPDETGAPPPPPSSRATAMPPADIGPLAEALGPVGGKITLQDAFGPQEYTFEGFDKKGKVVLTDADGVTLSEDPDWVQGAIKSGIVESEEGLGGMAFSTGVEEDVAAPPPPPPPPTATGIGSAPKPKFTIEPAPTTGDEFVSNILESKPVSSSVFSPDVAPPIFSPPTEKPKFTIEPAPPNPRNTQRQSKVGNVIFDQEKGVGQVPLNQGVNYRGFTAMMRPSKFLELAADLEAPKKSSVEYIRKAIDQGKGIGSPFLNLDFETGKVDSHDGRHRMLAILEKNGDAPVPVHIFGKGEQRARSLDEGKISSFASSMTGEDGRPSTDNFSEAFLDEAAVPVAAPPSVVAPPAAPRAVGKVARATLPATRQKVDLQYELQDLNNIRFAEGDLQNRDRSRPQTQQFLRRFINEFDPEGLGEDPSTDRGAPIISKDNTILSGNGRTLGLEEIYDRHPEQAEAYREFLREEGYDVEGIERPVLVRRLMSDVDERKFVVGSNEPDVAALSPPEQAAQDAKDILTPGVLSKYKGGDLNAARNDAFISAFIAEMSPQQRENAMDDKGNVSAQALKRIENALLYKAYGGTGRASEIFISKAMERTDDDTKTLTNSLVDVANDWIKFQQAIKDGEVDKKYDITNKLMEAVAKVSDIKSSGNSVSGELRSPDMVEPMDDFVKDILIGFHDERISRILSKKAIAEKLRAYTEIAANQQAEPDMFGMSETPSAREIWNRAAEGEGAQQPDMYADQEQTQKSAEGSIIGGTDVDIDAFRGKTLDNLLNHIASNNDGNYTAFDARLADRLNQLLSELQKAGAKVTLHIVQKGDAAPSSIAVGNARGLTDADLRTRKVDVYLRSPTVGNGGNSTEIILHEALHAVSGGSLLAVANGRGTPEMVKFRKELNDLRNKVITHFNARIKSLGKGGITEFERSMYTGQSNAFKDLDEFLTWGLTNKMAQDYLRSIEVGPKKSLFTKFVDAFRSLLNISPKDTSALAHLVDVINPLFETTAEDYMTTFAQEGPSEQKQSMQAEEDFDTEAVSEPTPAKLSRVRQSVNRLRTSATWSNIASQFSGARAADNWLARSYGLESLPETDSFYSAFETYLSKKNGKLQQLRRKYVDPIDDAVGDAIKNGVTMDDINDAIQARGAAERNAAIAEINEDMPDGGSGLTNAEAAAKLRELQATGKMRYINRVVRLHDRLRDETQATMVRDGIVSAETMAAWKKKYPNYTPYKGWAPTGDMAVDGQEDPHADYGSYDKGSPVYSRVAGLRAKPIKAAKGRSSQAANSLYNMIADAEMFLEMGQRNQIALQLDKTYQSDPDAFTGLLKIYDKQNPKIVNGKAVKITDERAFKNGIRGFKNGEPFIIDTAPNEEGQAVRRAFTNLDPTQLDKWLGGFYKVMGVLRGLHTRFNAAFWPREFLRSISDAVGNVYTEKGRKRSAAYGKSAAMKTWRYSWDPATQAGVFAHLINRDAGSGRVAHVKALTEEMVANGGAAGQEFAERAERVAKRMEAELKRMTATGVKAGYFETKAGFAKLIKVVDGINDFVDIVPRVAAYRALTEAGVAPKDAAQIALRSTLDMSKRGRFGRLIDSVFWWTTPSITNLTKKVTGLDSSTYRKLVLAQLSIGFALGMLNIMNAPDSDDDGEDDYSQLPEWRKLAYLHVYYSPDEKPFTMPIGFLFLFERYVGGKMAEVLAGQISDGKAAVDIMTASQDVGAAFLASLSPVVRSTEVRTLAPSSIAPIWDLNLNESFFKAPIYNKPFDDSEAQASRAKPTTPEVYKIIAKGLQEATRGYGRIPGDIDVSPDQIKYFVDQYAGGVGRLVSGAAEGDIEAVKKLNPFYFDPKLVEYSPMSSFYERDPEMKRAIAADKLADEGDSSERDFLENTNPVSVDSGVISAFKDAEKKLKDLRKDANEKDPKEYRAEQLSIMSEFNKAYNDAKKGNYSYTASADEEEEDDFIQEEEEGDE